MEKSLLAIALVFIITPLGQFLLSPLMTLTGVYQYLSPMLLVYTPNDKRYDLHNGTSFDYMFAYGKQNGGLSWQNQLLKYYLEGLLRVIQEIEENKLPETVEVRGSSYFFSSRTAESLGFEVQSTGGAEKFNILINYVDLVWMYSLSKGRLRFPRLKEVKTASTTGKNLIAKKQKIVQIKQFLDSRVAN